MKDREKDTDREIEEEREKRNSKKKSSIRVQKITRKQKKKNTSCSHPKKTDVENQLKLRKQTITRKKNIPYKINE